MLEHDGQERRAQQRHARLEPHRVPLVAVRRVGVAVPPTRKGAATLGMGGGYVRKG